MANAALLLDLDDLDPVPSFVLSGAATVGGTESPA
jgi:hypothetical protein